jgi:hypothetical protein
MERNVAEKLETTAYTIPKLIVGESPPFFRLEGECSQGIKDIVAQANSAFEKLTRQSDSHELKNLLQVRLKQTREKIFAQLKIEDQENDKHLVEKEIHRLCQQEGIDDTYKSFRFNVAVKNAKLGKSIVVRVNPRSEEAFVWQQPERGQRQVDAKILIVNGNHQREVLGRLFEIGERTDSLTAGKRGG